MWPTLDALAGTIRQRFSSLVLVCLLSGFGLALAQNPVPFVSQPLVPAAVAPGGPGFTLTVHGTGFVSGATVKWNDTPLTTSFASSAQLTATVPAANIMAAGTASVTVLNPGTSAASNNVFLSVVVPSPTVVYSNAPASPISLGKTGVTPNEPLSIAAADFNGDGKLDLALGIQQAGNPGYVNVLLGNGDGTYTPVSSLFVTGNCPCSIALGDINGDGKLDLAVANYTDNTVTILLGNGDGTLLRGSGSAPSVGAGPTAVAMGDFNGDKNLDLVVANSVDNALTVLLGNGDGTFTLASSPPAVGTPFGLGVGDFNGDGKLDVAVANFDISTVTILLGNGDGTFTPAPSPPATSGTTLAVGDFNGDGKLDLAMTDRGDSTVTVLLGNGDGTLTPINQCCGTSVSFTHTLGMTAGDFNGDGKLDLAVAIQDLQPMFPVDYVAILLGKGDGTFAPTDFSLLLPDDPFSLVVGDFNGDGKLDFATASDPYNYISVLLQTPPSGTGPDFAVSASGTSLTVQAGGTANYPIQVLSLDGFLGAVSLSCSGAPSHAMCSIPPASVFLFDSAIATITLSVTTTAPSQAVTRGVLPQSRRPSALWGALMGLMFVSALIYARRKSARAGVLAQLAALMGILFLTSCGGGSVRLRPHLRTALPPASTQLPSWQLQQVSITRPPSRLLLSSPDARNVAVHYRKMEPPARFTRFASSEDIADVIIDNNANMTYRWPPTHVSASSGGSVPRSDSCRTRHRGGNRGKTVLPSRKVTTFVEDPFQAENIRDLL